MPSAPSSTYDAQFLSLDQVERAIIDGDHAAPSDLAILKASSRALQAMSGPARAFATIVCEPMTDGGTRVIQGKDAILVARGIRARAAWRGDEAWAQLLGRWLLFRVVTKPAPGSRGGQRSTARIARRLGRTIVGG